jgi:cytochrome b6-f complex iron-sulfur subunit
MTTVLATLSSATIAAIVCIALINLFLIVLIITYVRGRKADRALEQAGVSDSVPDEAADSVTPPEKVMARRDFFRVAWLASLGLFAASFGAATLTYLWPNIKGGFGGKIEVSLDDVKSAINSAGYFYMGAGRFYIVPYSGKGVDVASGTDYNVEGVLADGLMPLYQRCVHLGCRVPFCTSSQWFECPCHGSKYNKAGEFQAGPAPRGMDRFKIEVAGSKVTVDTSDIVQGPPRGTETITQPPEGPFCA